MIQASPANFPETVQLLVAGGDERIALDPQRGQNRYGYGPMSDSELIDFGSSTASVISTKAFHAADQLRNKIAQDIHYHSAAEIYRQELLRIRKNLLALCDLGDLPKPDVVFASSGTDLHRITALLTYVASSRPVRAIMVDESETGSGVYAAIKGAHSTMDAVCIPLRNKDGSPRLAEEIDAEFTLRVRQACGEGKQVLLIQTDISKTGMIAPSYQCTAALQQSLGAQVDVLIDACQFRIAPATLRACLKHGYLVALTGSKFVGGPSFSGALLIPAQTVHRFRELTSYPDHADFPENWEGQGNLARFCNFGMLIRWEAALSELQAFRNIPDLDITNFMHNFSSAILARLDNDPSFLPVSVPTLDRRSLHSDDNWGSIQTIFPFQLYRTDVSGRRALDIKETQMVYHNLPTSQPRCQLGQPVNYGTAMSALRICLSARLIVQAAAQGGTNADRVIEQAQLVLDQASNLANSDPLQMHRSIIKASFIRDAKHPEVQTHTSRQRYLALG